MKQDKIVYWFDRAGRNWICRRQDSAGNQKGDAQFFGSKQGAVIERKRWMQELKAETKATKQAREGVVMPRVAGAKTVTKEEMEKANPSLKAWLNKWIAQNGDQGAIKLSKFIKTEEIEDKAEFAKYLKKSGKYCAKPRGEKGETKEEISLDAFCAKRIAKIDGEIEDLQKQIDDLTGKIKDKKDEKARAEKCLKNKP